MLMIKNGIFIRENPKDLISCSCSRLVWCMHKTIKIIVEATSGDRLTAFYPRLGSWWLAERKAGGSKRDKEREREKAAAIQLH